MSKKISRKWKRAGFTLITALAFSLIVGTILAGVGTLSMSHFGRSKVEAEYADAVSLADAGINYEIRWVSLDPTAMTKNCTSGTIGCPDQQSSAHSGAISGVPGSYSVYVRDWGTGCNGGNWTNPLNDVCVVATGTVDGISRTVQVRGKHKSIFDEFSIYAVSGGTFGGGGSGTTTTTIVGDMGTNGTLTFNGTKGTGIDQGSVYYNGSGTNYTSASNTVSSPDPVPFPSVSDLAKSMFPGGLTYLQTNNSNANIKMLKASDTALATEPTVSGFSLTDVSSKLASAGFTVNSRTFSDPTNSVPHDTSTLDKSSSPSSAWRFVQPATQYITSPYGVSDQSSNRVYFVPPGDYYFTNLNFKQGSSVVVFLTHLGPVHIWVDNTSNQKDSLNGIFLFTDPSPNKFRIYYNKCGELDIAGGSLFPGGFYAVNPACGPSTPYLNFNGNSEVLGSVISQYLNVTGGTTIVFPNNAGGDPNDFALWFGFKDNWKEISSNSNPVFVDGTSN